MKINNLNNLSTIRNLGGIKDAFQAEQKKESSATASASERTEKTDIFSGVIYSPGNEMEPRVKLLNEIIGKVNDGTYNSQDVYIKVAEKILEQGIIPGIQSSSSYQSSINPSDFRNKISSDYYSDSKVIKVTAGKLIDILGPGLFE